MRFLTMLILSTFIIFSCSEEKKAPVHDAEESTPVEEVIEEEVIIQMGDSVISQYGDIGLLEITDERIIIDLRYTTENNFMKVVLYDTLDRLFLQKDVTEKLLRCQDFLDSIRPGYRLKVFDGVRPLLVQAEMWKALDSIPAGQRGKFVSNPIYGSGHNYGTSVDLTICDSAGNELNMGAGYDDFRDIAFPSKEAHFLKTGELKSRHYANRLLLRRVMRYQKFYNIPSEWWHFNAYSRSTSEARYEILLNESGGHKKWHSPKIVVDSIVDSLVVVP